MFWACLAESDRLEVEAQEIQKIKQKMADIWNKACRIYECEILVLKEKLGKKA